MTKLLVKNGFVFDPMNNIEGDVKDILIENGRIVSKFSNNSEVKQINATGKTVIPAALDIHAHIASQQLNWARLIGSNNKLFQQRWKGLTLEHIAKSYLSNGYTYILETNVYPSLSKHTLFDLTNLPVLDTSFLLNVSNLWPLELEFQRGMVKDGAAFLSDMLNKTKAFGIKVYNPFEAENWNWKILRENLNEKGRLFNFTPINVYENLLRFVEELKLPHALHAHIEGYESKIGQANLKNVLNKLSSLDLEPSGSRNEIFHLAHASSYNIDGDNTELVNFYNNHRNFDLDLGFIGFNDINPLVTSDRRLINDLTIDANPYKVVRFAVEFEGDFFATFRKFDKKNYGHSILWANAYDLVFKIKDKWQLQFSINYPNYADIYDIPNIATLLLSSKARGAYMKDMNKDFLKDYPLVNNEETISFNDFIIITRASPAKSLGISHIKGGFTEGSDADLNVIDLNIQELNLDTEYEQLKNALNNIEYVIKDGKIIKHNENIDMNLRGKILWASGKVKEEDSKLLLKRKEDFFQKYNSLFLKSYSMPTKGLNLKEID